MTLIVDQRTRRAKTGSVRIGKIMWNRFNIFRRRRSRRRNRPEHEVLTAMSNYHLQDIGLERGEVTFGIVKEKGVFDDADQ